MQYVAFLRANARWLAGGFMALVLMAGVAQAQTLTTVRGTVVSKTGDTVVLMTDDGRRMTFAVDDTDVPTTVVVNSPIEVHYHTLDDGTYAMDTVVLTTAATTPNRTTVTGSTNDDDALPATASPVPALALLALFGFGAGYLMRRTAAGLNG